MSEKEKINQILEKIRAEKIKPEPWWKVNWKNYFFWMIWCGMVFLGALFLSLLVLNFLDLGPEFFHLFHFPLGRLIHFLIMTIPFFWLGLVLIAFFSGILALRKTKHGYRYNLLLIISLSLLAISFLGGILHFSHFNQKMGGHFFQKIPGAERELVFPMGRRWRLPEDGFIGGRILEVRQGNFLIENFEKEKWEIIFDNETVWQKGFVLKAGKMIGIVGEKIGFNKFKANFVREIFPRGSF